jgi:elongation factor P--(R)-beta-lysine ligase
VSRIVGHTVSLDALRARALLYQNLRAFFQSRQVIEVETPLLSSLMKMSSNSYDRNTQPIFCDLPIPAMQTLLNAGSGAIYQIAKQFRYEEIDRRHQAEFSIVQWSQLGWSVQEVLIELTALLGALFDGEFEPEQRTFQQAFVQRLGFNPDERSVEDLRQEARRLGLNASLGDDRQAWLKLMFVNFIEPTLGIDVPLYLTELPRTWRDHGDASSQYAAVSRMDVYIDGIKVGSVLESVAMHHQSAHDESEYDNSISQSHSPNLNIVFGLDRLLMIVLETRQIKKVFTMVES